MRTVVITGGNLFRIAAQYLGDATRWEEIARLNGLSDPLVTGLLTIRLPLAVDADRMANAVR
jgi:LysM domain